MGTATLAITVARALCRKPKMTSTTIATASASSICTCATEARMPSVRSASTATCTLPGRLCASSGSRALMASAVAITFAPGWRCTSTMMAGDSGRAAAPLPAWASFAASASSAWMAAQAPRRSFSAPSVTSATSFRRTGAPFL